MAHRAGKDYGGSMGYWCQSVGDSCDDAPSKVIVEKETHAGILTSMNPIHNNYDSEGHKLKKQTIVLQRQHTKKHYIEPIRLM